MKPVVIYAVGSRLVCDVEESLRRAGTPVAAAVRNHPGEVHLLDSGPLIGAEEVSAALAGLPYLVPLFTPANRQHAAGEAAELGFGEPHTLVDPSVARPASLEAGPGLYVNAGCSLGAASRFEEWVLVNRGAGIGHHAHLGRFASVGPGAVLAGGVTLGAGTVVGAGAVVLPDRTIGANAVVGAGSVVTQDIPGGSVALGNPARVVEREIAGFGDQAVV